MLSLLETIYPINCSEGFVVVVLNSQDQLGPPKLLPLASLVYQD